jgi:hypothetical protein
MEDYLKYSIFPLCLLGEFCVIQVFERNAKKILDIPINIIPLIRDPANSWMGSN